MMWAIPWLVLAGVAAGPLLAGREPLWARRLIGWMMLAVLLAGADFVLLALDPVIRMVGLCCVLLGGMKGLVYAEWAGREKLPIRRYLIFALLWFGMDPASFRIRRKGLSWKSDVRLGLILMFAGTVGEPDRPNGAKGLISLRRCSGW